MDETSILPVEHEIVLINGVPTRVSSAIPATEDDKNIAIVVIPGNPGCIGFYDVFISSLFDAGKRRFPVYGVSHAENSIADMTQREFSSGAGHTRLEEVNDVCQWKVRRERDRDFPSSFALEDQIEHKMCFLACHIPRNCKVVLIGHSVGAYICLEILKSYHDKAKIVKTILLFPTIENVGLSPSGRFWKFICFYLQYPFLAATLLASVLPSFVQKWSIGWWMYLNGVQNHESMQEAIQTLLNYTSIDNMLRTGRDLTTEIGDVDQTCIQENLDKLVFCYGRHDSWVPSSYYQEMAKKFPRARIEYAEDIRHAFILDSSEEMAKIVWKWLQEDVVYFQLV